jgi:hypothetical protein
MFARYFIEAVEAWDQALFGDECPEVAPTDARICPG